MNNIVFNINMTKTIKRARKGCKKRIFIFEKLANNLKNSFETKIVKIKV